MTSSLAAAKTLVVSWLFYLIILPLPAHSHGKNIVDADVAVVGAGYSGLLAARTVARAGFRVIILEARNRIGGRALSVSLANGAVADLGAGWIISPTHSQMIALAKEYGVKLYPTYIGGDGLVVDGNALRRVPMDELTLSPEHPSERLLPAAKVLGHIVAMSASLDVEKPWLFPNAERLDNITFLEWLKTNYPNLDAENWQSVERTIDGYIGPLSTTSALNVLAYAKMSHGFQNYAQMKDWLRADGGAASIAEKIGQELRKNTKVSLLLNNRVYRIDQRSTSAIVYATNATVRARRVIVAVPPPVVLSIDFRHNSRQIVPQAGALASNQRMVMMPGFKAMFVYKNPFWRKVGLSGYAASETEPIGSTWDASPADAHVGCLIMLSNPFVTQPRLADLSPDTRKQVLVDSLVKLFGPEAKQYTNYVEQLWDAEPFSLGSVGVPTIGSWFTFGQYLRQPMGRVYWAGSERATQSWAQMDGAVRSGIEVGNEVVASLSGKSSRKQTGSARR